MRLFSFETNKVVIEHGVDGQTGGGIFTDAG